MKKPRITTATITEGDQDAGCPTITAGLVSERWLAERAISEATLSGTFVDIGHSATLAHLRTTLAARLLHFGLSDLDGAAVRLHVPRAFTQEISAHSACSDSS